MWRAGREVCRNDPSPVDKMARLWRLTKPFSPGYFSFPEVLSEGYFCSSAERYIFPETGSRFTFPVPGRNQHTFPPRSF